MKTALEMFHDWAVKGFGPNYKTMLTPIQYQETERAFMSGFASAIIFSTQEITKLDDESAVVQIEKTIGEIRTYFGTLKNIPPNIHNN